MDDSTRKITIEENDAHEECDSSSNTQFMLDNGILKNPEFASLLYAWQMREIEKVLSTRSTNDEAQGISSDPMSQRLGASVPESGPAEGGPNHLLLEDSKAGSSRDEKITLPTPLPTRKTIARANYAARRESRRAVSRIKLTLDEKTRAARQYPCPLKAKVITHREKLKFPKFQLKKTAFNPNRIENHGLRKREYQQHAMYLTLKPRLLRADAECARLLAKKELLQHWKEQRQLSKIASDILKKARRVLLCKKS